MSTSKRTDSFFGVVCVSVGYFEDVHDDIVDDGRLRPRKMGACKLKGKGAGLNVVRDAELIHWRLCAGSRKSVSLPLKQARKFTKRMAKRLVLSALHIDFFWQLGDGVGDDLWVGVRWPGTTRPCTRSLRCGTKGLSEPSLRGIWTKNLLWGTEIIYYWEYEETRSERKNERMKNEGKNSMKIFELRRIIALINRF